MLVSDNYDDKGFGVSVAISDYDGSKYTYTYIIDLEDYAYKEGEGEFFTPFPLTPLDLPVKILTLVVENYFGKG